MYLLKIQGARRSTLAVHRCDTPADLRELLAVYQALGYKPETLQIEAEHQNQAKEAA
jgi:hypothetical protein